MAIYCIITSANLLNIGDDIFSFINISGQNLYVGLNVFGTFEINRIFPLVIMSVWQLLCGGSLLRLPTYWPKLIAT